MYKFFKNGPRDDCVPEILLVTCILHTVSVSEFLTNMEISKFFKSGELIFNSELYVVDKCLGNKRVISRNLGVEIFKNLKYD